MRDTFYIFSQSGNPISIKFVVLVAQLFSIINSDKTNRKQILCPTICK
jgi:hypothetical protein